MSFFESLVKGVAKEVKENYERQQRSLERKQRYINEYRHKSDKELRDIATDDSFFLGPDRHQKFAAKYVLNKRGK